MSIIEVGTISLSAKKALKSIDEDMYLKTLHGLVEKKYESLKEEQHLVRKRKLMDFMLQKGFEPDLVSGVLKEIEGKK